MLILKADGFFGSDSVIILALAFRFLLPRYPLLTFQFGGIAKSVGINRVVGAVVFIVRFVSR